jgi:hypothetical protein
MDPTFSVTLASLRDCESSDKSWRGLCDIRFVVTVGMEVKAVDGGSKLDTQQIQQIAIDVFIVIIEASIKDKIQIVLRV